MPMHLPPSPTLQPSSSARSVSVLSNSSSSGMLPPLNPSKESTATDAHNHANAHITGPGAKYAVHGHSSRSASPLPLSTGSGSSPSSAVPSPKLKVPSGPSPRTPLIPLAPLSPQIGTGPNSATGPGNGGGGTFLLPPPSQARSDSPTSTSTQQPLSASSSASALSTSSRSSQPSSPLLTPLVTPNTSLPSLHNATAVPAASSIPTATTPSPPPPPTEASLLNNSSATVETNDGQIVAFAAHPEIRPLPLSATSVVALNASPSSIKGGGKSGSRPTSRPSSRGMSSGKGTAKGRRGSIGTGRSMPPKASDMLLGGQKHTDDKRLDVLGVSPGEMAMAEASPKAYVMLGAGAHNTGRREKLLSDTSAVLSSRRGSIIASARENKLDAHARSSSDSMVGDSTARKQAAAAAEDAANTNAKGNKSQSSHPSPLPSPHAQSYHPMSMSGKAQAVLIGIPKERRPGSALHVTTSTSGPASRALSPKGVRAQSPAGLGQGIGTAALAAQRLMSSKAGGSDNTTASATSAAASASGSASGASSPHQQQQPAPMLDRGVSVGRHHVPSQQKALNKLGLTSKQLEMFPNAQSRAFTKLGAGQPIAASTLSEQSEHHRRHAKESKQALEASERALAQAQELESFLRAQPKKQTSKKVAALTLGVKKRPGKKIEDRLGITAKELATFKNAPKAYQKLGIYEDTSLGSATNTERAKKLKIMQEKERRINGVDTRPSTSSNQDCDAMEGPNGAVGAAAQNYLVHSGADVANRMQKRSSWAMQQQSSDLGRRSSFMGGNLPPRSTTSLAPHSGLVSASGPPCSLHPGKQLLGPLRHRPSGRHHLAPLASGGSTNNLHANTDNATAAAGAGGGDAGGMERSNSGLNGKGGRSSWGRVKRSTLVKRATGAVGSPSSSSSSSSSGVVAPGAGGMSYSQLLAGMRQEDTELATKQARVSVGAGKSGLFSVVLAAHARKVRGSVRASMNINMGMIGGSASSNNSNHPSATSSPNPDRSSTHASVSANPPAGAMGLSLQGRGFGTPSKDHSNAGTHPASPSEEGRTPSRRQSSKGGGFSNFNTPVRIRQPSLSLSRGSPLNSRTNTFSSTSAAGFNSHSNPNLLAPTNIIQSALGGGGGGGGSGSNSKTSSPPQLRKSISVMVPNRRSANVGRSVSPSPSASPTSTMGPSALGAPSIGLKRFSTSMPLSPSPSSPNLLKTPQSSSSPSTSPSPATEVVDSASCNDVDVSAATASRSEEQQ